MKKTMTRFRMALCAAFMFLLPAVAIGAPQQDTPLPLHRDVSVVSVNKEPAHSSFMIYGDRAKALTGDYAASTYYKLLNGTWKFLYNDNFDNLPAEATDPSFDVSSWADIKVPGNWEFQGFGTPIYVNHPFEFKTYDPIPPLLPDEIPGGVYRHDFEVPAGWDGRDIYLHLAAAKSGVYVYVNGQWVGYSEESKDPAEFLLNPYLKEGKNTLALKISRWSTGSYLECQDFWRVSGIERDVFLWSRPAVSLADFAVRSNLDDTYTDGLWRLNMSLRNSSTRASEVVASYELTDNAGRVVLSGSESKKIAAGASDEVSFEGTLANVAKWTAETPNLYKLMMSVSVDGGEAEYIPWRVGFRRIEIKESEHVRTDQRGNTNKLRLFYVNGQPIKLKGVNIHETGINGHYLTAEQMRRNFELMKLNNVNSVRLAHYPQDRKFYEMCDEFGIYVYDEANIESHGMYYTIYPEDPRMGSVGHIDGNKKGTLGNNPDWLDKHLERFTNMFQRNKNYASVTIWSMGNEAGNGTNFYAGYDMLKEMDKGLMDRPVAYERAGWERNTDMYVPQYPSAASLRRQGERGADRPVVPSEYSHAMGNSNGDLYNQWLAIYDHPQLQGGYIWDWIDQSPLVYDANGKPYFAYGGDMGTEYTPSDGNFVDNGIVNPDQDPHPSMSEVKYTHQNVNFEAVDLAAGEFRITNRFYFTNLGDYKIRYEVRANEKPIRSEELTLRLEPQTSTVITIPYPAITAEPGVEYFVNFAAVTTKATELVPAGHVAAYEQFQLPVEAAPKATFASDKNAPKLKVTELKVAKEPTQVTISSPQVFFAFDIAKGVATSYKVNGVEYFDQQFGIRPNFWRGPTDNDYGKGFRSGKPSPTTRRLPTLKSPRKAEISACRSGMSGA